MEVATGRGRASSPPPLLFGTILFLASELLFFGGLFAAYFTLRAQTPEWPPAGIELDAGLSAFATLVLIVSSFTLQFAIRGAANGKPRKLRWLTVLTIALGALFVGLQIWDWAHLNFEISSNAYGTMYYAMTGFHMLHVIAGILLMLVILGRLAQGAYRTGEHLEGPEAITMYWHFVDVVWIALFATIFLLR